jgi:hypothetical protein
MTWHRAAPVFPPLLAFLALRAGRGNTPTMRQTMVIAALTALFLLGCAGAASTGLLSSGDAISGEWLASQTETDSRLHSATGEPVIGRLKFRDRTIPLTRETAEIESAPLVAPNLMADVH